MNAQLDELEERFNQLENMSLHGRLLIVACLDEIQRTLHYYSCSFCWIGSDNLSDIFDIRNQTLFMQNYTKLCAEIPDLHDHMRLWLKSLKTPISTNNIDITDKYLIEIYRNVLMPIGYLSTHYIPVLHPRNKETIGVLMLHQKCVSHSEETLDHKFLENIRILITSALISINKINASVTDGWEQGMLIVDQYGSLNHACNIGYKLLNYASNKKKQTLAKSGQNFSKIQLEGLDELLESLTKKNHRTNDNKPSSLTVVSSWGVFNLSGYLIKDLSGNRSPQFVLLIKWQIPFELSLFMRIRQLELTKRQESVALMYASGAPVKIISNNLNISVYTVKEHIHNIFKRIGINSRSELISQIFCDNEVNKLKKS